MKSVNSHQPLTLQRKMVLSFAFILPVAILLIGISLTIWISRTTKESLIDKYELIDAGIAGEIQMLKTNDERMLNSLTQNKMIQDALTEPPAESFQERYELFRNIQGLLTGVNVSAITGIYLAGENGEKYRSNNVLDLAALYPDRWAPFYEEAVNAPEKAHWHISDSDVLGDSSRLNRSVYVFMTHAIRTRSSLKNVVGVGLARISYSRYLDTLRYALSSNNEYAFIVDGEQRVFAHTSDQSAPGKPLDDKLLKYASGSSDVVNAKELGGLFLRVRAPGSDWTLVHFIPNAALRDIPSKTYTFIWAVMLLSFLVMLISLSLFARTITKPVHRLSRALRRFGEGNLDERVSFTGRRDEIGVLGKQFNQMADELKQYVRLVEENHRARAKLEMNVLENQINPHFLYNVLDLIHWKANRAGNKDISEMTVYLARFCRLTLHLGHEFVTVEDEVEHAKTYLLICKMRYGDSFAYTFDVDAGLLRTKIKKILLQPVLENCIKYGMNPETTDNLFAVRVKDDGSHILLSVADNGGGMTEEKLIAVRRRMTSDEYVEDTGSFGLYNLYARLAFAYKDDFSLTIDSAPGRGTILSIRIPKSL